MADYVPNDDRSDVYATADVIAADQWSQMARDAFVTNRLFNVAAAGFVISHAGPGVRELFGCRVPTYRTAAKERPAASLAR